MTLARRSTSPTTIDAHGYTNRWKQQWEVQLEVEALDGVEIALCRATIAMFGTRSPGGRTFSYSGKHLVERWVETLADGHEYVGNGSFMCAADLEGIPCVPDGYKSLNAWCCVSLPRRDDWLAKYRLTDELIKQWQDLVFEKLEDTQRVIANDEVYTPTSAPEAGRGCCTRVGGKSGKSPARTELRVPGTARAAAKRRTR
jgi:hypothetical protein